MRSIFRNCHQPAASGQSSPLSHYQQIYSIYVSPHEHIETYHSLSICTYLTSLINNFILCLIFLPSLDSLNVCHVVYKCINIAVI